MEIDVKRNYEILPDNNIILGIRITNISELVISDVQVVLDYNESLFRLQEGRILKLGSIPPARALTVKFTLKPMGIFYNDKIGASIIYRDPKWEKHIADMQPVEIQLPGGNPTLNSDINLNKKKEEETKKDRVVANKKSQSTQDADVARMYDTYLEEIRSKHNINGENREISIIPYSRNPAPTNRKLKTLRSTPPSRQKEEHNLKEKKKSKKKILMQMGFILTFLIVAAALIQIPFIKNNIGTLSGSPATGPSQVESTVLSFVNAVNESQYAVAFNMYQGQDLLVPASVEMLFNNGGIKSGSVRQTDISSVEIEGDTAVAAVNCTVVSVNILGKETDVSVIPVYFELHDLEQGWTVTSISFIQPFDLNSGEAVEVV